MANLMDQYESHQYRGSGRTQRQSKDSIPEPISTGFISARLEDEVPIFNKQKIQFKPRDPITHLKVSNNMLVLAMSSNLLLRIDLENKENTDEVEISHSLDNRPTRLHLDPLGRHLLISMSNQETLYLSRNSKKPKPLVKLKGYVIESVGWNNYNTSDMSTGPILFGTSRGLIFEGEIVSEDESKFFAGAADKYFKQVFSLGKENPSPVNSLHFDRMPHNSQSEQKYFIMATTPGRLYQFIGTIPVTSDPPIFQPIFANYEDSPARFLELPGNFGYSNLQYYHPKGIKSAPEQFAWMTGPGVYFGNFDLSPQQNQDVTSESKLIAYPSDNNTSQNPLSIVLTEFHILLVFPDCVKAICHLNEQLIFEDFHRTGTFGKLLGMSKDPIKGSIWSFSDQAVFKYKVVRESRDVWQMYLDRGEYDLALAYCKDNPANRDKVLTKHAEHFFQEKQYDKSAMLYAQTQNSFEEVALKFIQMDQQKALQTFLWKKLNGLKPVDKTQTTMLVTWLIELYLNRLGALKEQGLQNDGKYYTLRDEFRKFLAHQRVKDCLSFNKNTAYDLIASHGNIEDLVFFAMLMHDYERVISHHIQHDDYRAALDVLTNKQGDTELYYKFSPVLMQYIPKQTVDSWIAKGRKLDPQRLIPALVNYDHSHDSKASSEAIRYLEFCVHDLSVQDTAIHNYLLSLYAKLQPEQLIKYLRIQGQNPDSVPYDLKYALRLCAEHSHKEACVHIYRTMGLFEEAVELALQVDVNLAKVNADLPEDDEELRKKLWLRIARHVVEEEKDIKKAMEFLHECDLLKIEDVLPFFPDFVTIDHFKDAICMSLQEYNQHIEALKEEMQDATESAKSIRSDIQEMRNKYSVVKAQGKCSSCRYPLLTRGFYLFPCQHVFHSDCLVTEVTPNMTSARRNKVDNLLRDINSAPATPQASAATDASAATTAMSKGEQQKSELDDMIASECPYCGEMMIMSIDKPFIEPKEFDEVVQSWQ
ncbi:vacuolar protein sorting-associated protein 18 homolog isoform X2 [Branchiostoma floridae x Branchiostoma japonicum]